uniref:cytochrome-c oxidase n=1 Tax=Plagiorchis maculosus TaxID=168655 RepID=A0A4D6C6J6_9TREM|nr:cytochrome c oxidase subunit II [Plagiorchis maculosus]QBX99312.1 cytochrome c oxidase subunit 2 [Plagiorchis maculosus]
MLLFNMLYLDLILYMIMLCSFIPVWVFFVLGWQVCSWNDSTVLRNESNLVELGWTIVPTAAVSILCFLNLLCLGDEPYFGVSNIVKAVGCQWYWSYEIVGVEGNYDSVMTDFIDSVDKPLRLTQHSPHILLVTSSDVVHSFALPVFNIKLDCIPGRMNQTIFWPDRMGIFVGYCSELCGAGHAFMPIVVEVIKKGLQGC